ncbi:MAG TPA: isochorismatase family cysteine hydrolase [Spirochaetia bacterium]|nr:isochorismatase family cysteine hydrolase [Spirochaetia bacterium]
MKLALVVIDMQKCFLSEYPDSRPIKECCMYINHVSRILRKAGHVIIHVKDMEEADQLSAEELDFTNDIEIDPSDLLVEKKQSNAFWNTELDHLIQEKGVELLILCGQAAEHCVVFTYNGARERGHRVVVLQNAVISQKPGRAAALLEDRNSISYPVIEIMAAS